MNIYRSLIILVSMSPTLLQAANLFVNSENNGANCIATAPCATIQEAINLAESNDTIHVAAGTYFENIAIPNSKDGLTIRGARHGKTNIVSAGGDVVPKQAPAGVPVDIIVDIFAPNVTIANLTLIHPADEASKRDMGVFIRPPAINATIRNCHVKRERVGAVLEPTAPGSRAIFAIRTSGTAVLHNTLSGNYQDHIHFPTSGSTIRNNKVLNATRIGITIIQENATTLSEDNLITANKILNSGGDGIQIQGDSNVVFANKVIGSGGYGIHLCGESSNPGCVPPGQNATASQNIVKANRLKDNSLGNLADYGSDNIVK